MLDGCSRLDVPKQRSSFSGHVLLSREGFSSEDLVLVTGGTGLAGSAIRDLIETEPALGGVDREWVFAGSTDADLREYAQAHRLFEAVRPTHVIHLATVIRPRSEMAKQKGTIFSENLEMNQNVLRCAQLFRVRKLVACLCPITYPALKRNSVSEGELHWGPPHDAVSGLAHSKRMLDFMTQCMREEDGLDFVTVCPSHLVGLASGGSFRKDGSVFEANIARCLEAKASGGPYCVFGAAEFARQILYVGDFARLLIWAMDSYSDMETLNLTGTDVSIREVATAIAAACGFTGKIELDSQVDSQGWGVLLSGAKLERLCPAFTRTPFREAISEIVSKYMANNAGDSTTRTSLVSHSLRVSHTAKPCPVQGEGLSETNDGEALSGSPECVESPNESGEAFSPIGRMVSPALAEERASLAQVHRVYPEIARYPTRDVGVVLTSNEAAWPSSSERARYWAKVQAGPEQVGSTGSLASPERVRYLGQSPVLSAPR